MRVKGDANPGTAPRIEHDIGRLGYIEVRIAENIINVEFGGTDSAEQWEYDEYRFSTLEVNRADIEAHPDQWLQRAKDWESQQLAAHEQRLKDEQLAQEQPAVSGIVFVTLAQSGQLDDITISEHAAQFPAWDEHWRGKAGAIVQDEGALYRSIHDVTDAGQNRKPSETPSMWTRIADPAEEWPAWSQPIGTQDAYALDAKASHAGKHWTSDYPANTWEPGVFGWTEA